MEAVLYITAGLGNSFLCAKTSLVASGSANTSSLVLGVTKMKASPSWLCNAYFSSNCQPMEVHRAKLPQPKGNRLSKSSIGRNL